MRVNKLIGLESTLEFIKDGIPYDEFKDRQTGRSLSIAFNCIHLAMDNEGRWVRVVDHHGTTTSNKDLLDTIRDLIDKLDLKCFEFKVCPPQIRYKLFDEYKEVEVLTKTTVWRKK